MNGHVSFSTQRAPKTKTMKTTQWGLDFGYHRTKPYRSIPTAMQSTSFLASSLVAFGAILFYCIYFCINLSSLLPLLCLLSHFTRASPVPCTVRVTMGKKVQRVCFSSYFIICSHFHAQKQLSHKWLTCFPFKFNWQWLADLACQSDNSYKQQVIFRVTLLLLSYVGDYNSPHPFPSPPPPQQ